MLELPPQGGVLGGILPSTPAAIPPQAEAYCQVHRLLPPQAVAFWWKLLSSKCILMFASDVISFSGTKLLCECYQCLWRRTKKESAQMTSGDLDAEEASLFNKALLRARSFKTSISTVAP